MIDADEFDMQIDKYISLIDVFISSKQYFVSLYPNEHYERGLKEICSRGPRVAITTLGKKGCAGFDGNEYFTLPVIDLPVIDSTGAGDVFHGAYIHGMLKGWKAKQCARFATAVASAKCTAIGGRAGIPNFKTAIRLMETGMLDNTEIKKRVDYYRKGLTSLLL